MLSWGCKRHRSDGKSHLQKADLSKDLCKVGGDAI